MQNISPRQKIIFSQITSLIPWYQFDKIVSEFGGDYRYKKFKSRDHLLDPLRNTTNHLNSTKFP